MRPWSPPQAAQARIPRSTLSAGRDRGGEFLEELVRHLLGGAGDQPLAQLGELAADLRLDIVGEQGAAVLGGEHDLSTALGEARNAALAFARDLVAVGRIEIGEMDLALPLGLDGPDLGYRDRLEFRVRELVELLAARDADLQHVGVVELRPYRLARRVELDFSVHRHGHGGISSRPTAADRAAPIDPRSRLDLKPRGRAGKGRNPPRCAAARSPM